MKTLLSAITLSSCFAFSANAGYINGSVLKSMSIAPVSESAHLQYVGYVIGVIDSDQQRTICVDVPGNALTPVLEAVKNYLAANPNKLNDSGNSLVIKALMPLYACKHTD
ncbi:MAG: hypothetical protein HRT35_18090 [Algicola sp.]|nr:hypothetical protein [Algicola sp.]